MAKKKNGAAKKVKALKSAIVTTAPPRAEIERRAFELFLARGQHHGAALEDWLRAEAELGALPQL